MSNHYHETTNDLVKSELHHICTTLEIDPIDEVEVQGRFALCFGHPRVASKVARLAADALNKSKPSTDLWKPLTVQDGRFTYATVII